MAIRRRVEADLDALVAVAEAVYAADGYPGLRPTDWSSFLVSSDALDAWVAEFDGRVLGHVALHRSSMPIVMETARSRLGSADDDQLGVVARLFVDPGLRRSGAGRRLLETAMSASRALGRHPILDVVTRFAPAVALYERCGWINAGRVELVFGRGESVHSYVFLAPSDGAQA